MDELFLTERELVKKIPEIRFTEETLQGYRYQKKGPPFYKLSGKIFYRESEVREWIRQSRITPSKST